MSEKNEKIYCGVGDVPKGKRRGNMKECAEANQIRYFGINKVDSKLLDSVKKNKTQEKNKEKLREETMFKIVGLKGTISKLNREIKQQEYLIEKKRTPGLIEENKKEIDKIEKKIKKIRDDYNKKIGSKSKDDDSQEKSKNKKGGSNIDLCKYQQNSRKKKGGMMKGEEIEDMLEEQSKNDEQEFKKVKQELERIRTHEPVRTDKIDELNDKLEEILNRTIDKNNIKKEIKSKKIREEEEKRNDKFDKEGKKAFEFYEKAHDIYLKKKDLYDKMVRIPGFDKKQIQDAKDDMENDRNTLKMIKQRYAKDGITITGMGIVDTIKNIFKPRLDDFNNVSKKTIKEYGNKPIVRLQIYRTPISNMINNIFNLVSLGKWNELKHKYGFDKLWHLALVATVEGGKNVIMEKNAVVNISTSYKTDADTETFDVPLNKKDLTVYEMLNDARQKVGDYDFFRYDSFNANCQMFIRLLLQTQGLWNEQIKEFVFQDFKELVEELPGYVHSIANKVTDLGATYDKLTGNAKNKTAKEIRQEIKKKYNLKQRKEMGINLKMPKKDLIKYL